MSDAVRNDAGAQRYEMDVEGHKVIAAYRREGGVIVFTHTRVPDALQGQGIASKLIAGALADVRDQGLKIVPQCEFVAAYIARHPEEATYWRTDC